MATCALNDPARLADHQKSRVAAFESAYPLTPGKRYGVAGMGITEAIFYFLVRDDLGAARFAPAGMFELVESPIPVGWHFSLGPGVRASGRDLWADPVVATWGYRELVEDPRHFSALIDEDPAAVAVFAREISAAEASGQE